jgi:D-alanyl-D-alanine carboxypeptidase
MAVLLLGALGVAVCAAPRSAEAARYASIIIDAETGDVIHEVNADAQSYPASLTKMMTLYLVFEGLETGKLRLDQRLPISQHAANRAPSKLGLVPGDTIAVRDVILGLVTKSANDAASVAAEALGGSEPAFAEKMTQKARKLGMTNTTYRNASGLPDPAQKTTARDLAKLSLALYRDFPQYWHYFGTREFSYGGRVHANHNHLMSRFEGMDGIKTGFINASGFNLAASAVRNNRRLIGVVMGGESARSRDNQMAKLLNAAFAGSFKGHDGGTQMVSDEPADDAEKPGIAKRTIAALSPVSRAEAAPVAGPAPKAARRHAAASGWSIQLGAYGRKDTAEKAASTAKARLASIKGKPVHVVSPDKGDKEPLYRVRLANFSKKEAQNACRALHRKRVSCQVVAPQAKAL